MLRIEFGAISVCSETEKQIWGGGKVGEWDWTLKHDLRLAPLISALIGVAGALV